MSLSAVHSQVEEVRSTLSDLQANLAQLPLEKQNQVINEIEQTTIQLRAALQIDGQLAKRRKVGSEIPPKLISTPGFEGSEPWLGRALELAHVGAWKWDLVNWTVQWTDELYRLLGMDPAKETLESQTFNQMVHPEDRAQFDAEFNAAVARGGQYYMEFRAVRRDGKIIWLSSAGTVEHDAQGRPTQAAGINQDITARKQAEEALRLSEARERARAAELEALMDAVPAIIWISRDPQCEEMIGNRYGYELLQMWEGANLSKTAPEDELARQPYRNYKEGREIPSSELPMQIAAATGVGTSDYEFDLVFNNGVTKNLLGNIIPLTDADGNPAGAVAAFVDITERKRVEAELRQSEAQLKEWKEQINIWSKATNSFFWVLDPDGSYSKPGPIDAHISGSSFEQTRGLDWIKTVHPEDQELLRDAWRKGIEEQKAFTVETRVWHAASQQYRWFIHRVVPIVEAGTINCWVGATMDIQARKEMEQALKEREAALRESEAQERTRAAELNAIMDAVPAPILLARDPEGTVITGNAAAYKVLQAQPGSNLAKFLYGQPDSHFVIRTQNHAGLQPEEIPLLVALRTGKPVKEFEGTVEFDDGRQMVLYGNATPLLDESAKATGAVGVFMDISGRIAAERALRESEQRLRVALASAPIAVFTMDRDLRYTWVYNTRLYDGNKMLGKRDDEINLPENVVELIAAKEMVLETGRAVQREFKLKVNDAWYFYLITMDPLLNRHGQVEGIIGAAFDITKLRHLEAVTRENEIKMATQRRLLKIRENERVKIARDIHDGPVQTLVGATFNLHQLHTNISDPSLLAELEPVGLSVKAAIHELRQVINELRPPILAQFGLVKAIQRSAEEVREKHPSLELVLDLAPESRSFSESFSLVIYRICQEALHNIYRHAKATQANIRLIQDQGQAVLEIQDNGKGFAFDGDYSIFTGDRHFGLSGMKERAEAVGGTFRVETKPGQGTKIKVIIPVMNGE